MKRKTSRLGGYISYASLSLPPAWRLPVPPPHHSDILSRRLTSHRLPDVAKAAALFIARAAVDIVGRITSSANVETSLLKILADLVAVDEPLAFSSFDEHPKNLQSILL